MTVQLETFEQRRKAERDEQHYAGVHVNCVNSGSISATGAHACPQAGTVENLHTHGFDGPLICGCDDWA